MNVEAVTGRVEWLRDEVMRLGARVMTQGRLASEFALRGSAHALTQTAKRLDTLADRIADEAPGRDANSADVATPASVDTTTRASVTADVKRDERASDEAAGVEASSDEAASVEAASVEAASVEAVSVEAASDAKMSEVARGASTPEARVHESKKKHRHNRRPR